MSEKVKCLKCDKEHDATPPARNHVNKDGVMVFGIPSTDYTYYRDNYKNLGYGVLCKTHDRDSISTRELYSA